VPRFIADSSLSASIKVVYANGDGEYEDLFNKDLKHYATVHSEKVAPRS
jgi:hypothetical protein